MVRTNDRTMVQESFHKIHQGQTQAQKQEREEQTNVINAVSKATGQMHVQSKRAVSMGAQDNSQIGLIIKEVSMEVQQVKMEVVATVKSRMIQNKNVTTAKKVVIGRIHVLNQKKPKME